MLRERAFATLAALVLTTVGFQQLLVVPPAYAAVLAVAVA